MSWWETAIETLRGKPTQAPAPFDRQANATAPLMGPSDIIPEAVTQATGSDLAGIAAGFLSPTSMLRKPMRSDAITKGGDPNLLLTHGSSLEGLLRMLRSAKYKPEHPIPALDTPSMAIARIPKPFASADVDLYMQPSKFDPAVTPRADLWPIDAYTYRRAPGETNRFLHEPKLRKNAKLSEGMQPEEITHLMAVLAAPKFKSFNAFEKMPQGAGRIANQRLQKADFNTPDITNLRYDFLDWFYQQPDIDMLNQSPDYLPFITRFLKENPVAKKQAQLLPSQYGELKYHGSVPITPEYVAAARITPRIKDAATKIEIEELTHLLKQQQIPIMGNILSQPATTQEQIAEYVDQLTGLRGQRRYPR
jgi:hypothetical protein